MEFATRTIHAEQPSEPGTGSLVAPIFQTSTYEQEAPGIHQGFDYSRTNNPTRARLEAVLADLEGVSHAAAFASGLAAESAVLQAWLKPGDEIVVPVDVYGGTYRLLTKVFRPLGCAIRQIDVSDAAALSSALSDRTRLVWIESPTNPRLLIYDIAAIAAAAHARGALLVVDNTFATPLFQQPFQLGADIVVHSVTKYLAGHSDLIQGAVLAKDASVFEPIKFLQNATGAVPSPFDCWLTLRGLKTLELRVLRHAENAAAIAEALAWASARSPRLLSRPRRSSRSRDRAEADDGLRRHGLVRARRLDRRRRVVRVLAAVFRARREPRRRQGTRLPPGADDPRVDSRD